MDLREAKIIYQNALGHATRIAIHNAKDGEVSVEDVLTLAKRIAREVITIGTKEKTND